MAIFITPKLNHITEQLQQISSGTSNSGTLNSVISYINSNVSRFSPAIDYTQLNSTIQTYMTNNINLFKGAKGDPYVIPQSDLDQALTDYVNTHPTSFVKSVANKSNVVVLTQGDILSGPIVGTTATLSSALTANAITVSNLIVNGACTLPAEVEVEMSRLAAGLEPEEFERLLRKKLRELQGRKRTKKKTL